ADLSVRRGTGSTPQRTREWDPFQQM
nr:SP21=major development-specific protein {N-terminal} [Stigmatella aurantiaca, DW4, spores, Peptide Partial, 25 aa] [Stigmatella aurantiaca]